MEPSNFSDQAGQAKRHLAHEPGNLTERQSAGPAPPQSPVTLKTQSEKRATRAQTPCIACRQRHLEQCDETWPSCRKTKSAHVASWPRVPGREARHYGHSFVPIPRASDIALPASSRNVSPSPLPSERFQNRSLDDPFRLSSRFQERRKKVEREEERARAAVIGNSFHGREMEELPSQLHDYFVFDSGINLSTGERIRATDNSGNVPLNGEVESGFPINALSHSEYWPSTIPESPPFFPGLGLQMPLEDPPELSHAQGSGATTVPMDQAQRDISELSGTIHGRISENVDLDDGKLPSSKQNAPFTDSGYASGINIDHLPQMELGDANTSGYGNNDIGSKTVYSGASTVPMDQAQRYISELCSTIHGRINENIDVDNWTSLSERLSELIKDFAIKLGLESSVQINQDIMYFIHKRGREIAKQLDSMVLSVDAPTEDIDGGQKAKGDHMPLNDKMALWTSKDIEIETSLNASELFVGVTDIEETLDIPELSKYNEAVTESNSFKWLIESLRRELVLNRDPDKSGGCNHREILRRKVIQNLPTGKISKTRPPTTHHAAFRLPGWPLLGGLVYSSRPDSKKHQNEAFVVTCCSENSQAISVEEYMAQTWPSTWRQIFNLLQAVTRRAGGSVYADILHDKTHISSCYEHDYLKVRLEGPAHTIAECGEQLAWLQAVYLCAPSDHAMENIIQRIPGIVNVAKLCDHICFDIGVEKSILEDSAPLEQSRWTQVLRSNNLAFVPGYPVPRRPNDFNGIEISPHYLVEFQGRVFRSASSVRLLLNGQHGPPGKFALVRQVESVYLWHEIQGARKYSCPCTTTGNQDKGIGRNIDLAKMKSGRHIIGHCDGIRVDADGSLMAPDKEFRLENDSSMCPSRPSTSIMEVQRVESLKTPASSENRTLKNGGTDVVASFLSDEDANSWTSCQHSAGSDMHEHPHESTESSLDSDLLSMSDSSEGFEPLDDDHPIRAVLEIVVSRLVSGYRSAASGEVPSCGNGSKHGTETSSSSQGIGATFESVGKGRKRKQVQNDDSDSEDDATHPPSSKRFKKEQQPIKVLACPFGKMSPSKHSGCSRYQLKRIRDVKQHLKRKHTPDDYCRRCLRIFRDEESLTQHVSKPDGFGCQPAPQGKTLEGLSQRQSRDLSRKSNPEFTDEQQWFAIWDIVFPGKPRPESAYLDSAVAMRICQFREHCAQHGEQLLAENLRAAGLLDEDRVTADQGQLLRRIIAESLDYVCDTFSPNAYSDSGMGRSTNRSLPSDSNNSTHNGTPAASLVDSGVGLGSQMANPQPGLSLFAPPNTAQQDIQPEPSDLPPSSQAPVSEEGAFFGLPIGEFPKDHDPTSVEQGLDVPGTFDFNLPTYSPPPELSSWIFTETN